jgi:hypothetical protein
MEAGLSLKCRNSLKWSRNSSPLVELLGLSRVQRSPQPNSINPVHSSTHYFVRLPFNIVGRDSLESTVSRYGEPIPVTARYSTPVRTGPETHPASYTMSMGSLPGLK